MYTTYYMSRDARKPVFGVSDQVGYREADLRLCFRIGNYPVFSRRGSNAKKKSNSIKCLGLPHKKKSLKNSNLLSYLHL